MYKESGSYESLEFIVKSLKDGVSQKEVESLLGEPDHSPIEGLYYYSSNKRIHLKESGQEHTIGAVLDYRNSGQPTNRLQHYNLGPIGE